MHIDDRTLTGFRVPDDIVPFVDELSDEVINLDTHDGV